MKNLSILSEEILGPSKRVAIIGNGGLSSSDVDFLGSCDHYIRFNNFATRAGIDTDKVNCDTLFTTFDLHSASAKPENVVIGIPYPFKAEDIEKKQEKWYSRSRIWMVNPYENMNLCTDLKIPSIGYSHPLPSLGFTALWHMRNWNVEFKVAGFNWYYDEGTGKFQNWDISRDSPYPTHWNHNYPKEVTWIALNLFRDKRFKFSTTCSRLIKIALEAHHRK